MPTDARFDFFRSLLGHCQVCSRGLQPAPYYVGICTRAKARDYILEAKIHMDESRELGFPPLRPHGQLLFQGLVNKRPVCRKDTDSHFARSTERPRILHLKTEGFKHAGIRLPSEGH